MYKIEIRDELELESYNRLISYALSKSDAFMLVTYRYIENKKLMTQHHFKKTCKNDKSRIMKYYDEVKRKKRKDAAIFIKSTEPLLRRLKPFLIKTRNYPTVWPSANVIFYDDYTSVDICTYKACEEVKPYLMETKGLFNWKYPYYSDDLCFFKGGYCWFSTLAHEEYACIYVEDSKDVEKIKEFIVNFDVNKCNEEDVDLFYEKYRL